MAAILPLHLPDHLPTLLISTVGFAAIHHLGAPEFARFLLGKKGWDALGSRDRVGWCVYRVIIVVVKLVIALSWIACFAWMLMEEGTRVLTTTTTLQFIGNRAWHRSSTRCSSSRWPRAVSISLRSRPIARSGGTHASAPSLPLRAGKNRTSRVSFLFTPMVLTPPTRFLADTFCGMR